MGAKEARIAGCPALLLRISFSGELAYEIHTPSGYGTRVWQALIAAGESEGIVPYGTEAMGMLRLEKGHVAGAELDGRTTPADLGLERLASRNKDYVGRAALDRPALLDPKRLRLVGLLPEDGRSPIRAGAQIIEDPAAPTPLPILGHVTSADLSPMLEKPIALALVSGGLERKGQTLHATYPLKGETVAVVVTDPVFFDPEGKRLHG
jgi:sarcosine oxidase subunit alpha